MCVCFTLTLFHRFYNFIRASEITLISQSIFHRGALYDKNILSSLPAKKSNNTFAQTCGTFAFLMLNITSMSSTSVSFVCVFTRKRMFISRRDQCFLQSKTYSYLSRVFLEYKFRFALPAFPLWPYSRLHLQNYKESQAARRTVFTATRKKNLFATVVQKKGLAF